MKQGLWCTLLFVSAALPVAAHHSFPAQYDVDKPITLTGKVTKVEWTNPHIFIYADVPDANGAFVKAASRATAAISSTRAP